MRAQEEIQRKARRAFGKEEYAHLSEQQPLDDEQRHADMVAKTNHLCKLRLAREAAWRDTAQAAANAQSVVRRGRGGPPRRRSLGQPTRWRRLGDC